jgi:hypothetical protein
MAENPALLVIEDGDDYIAFARLFLGERFTPIPAKSLREALPLAAQARAILLDLRFDLSPEGDLIGDVAATAARLFGGDAVRALGYLRENQGVLILAELRKAGCHAPALIINDLPARRLGNLRAMYGAIGAVPDFDAQAIRAAFDNLLGSAP